MTAPRSDLNICIIGMLPEGNTGFGRVTSMVYDTVTEVHREARVRVYTQVDVTPAMLHSITCGRRNVCISVMDWITTTRLFSQLPPNVTRVAYAPLDTDTIPARMLTELRAELIIPQTDFAARLYRDAGHRVSDVVRYHHSGYDADNSRNEMRRLLCIPPSGVAFVTVNDYTWRKRVNAVIDAYKGMRADNTRLIVVSRGIPDSHIKYLVDRDDIIIFNNDVSEKMLHQLYYAGDVFVTFSAGEGFGWTAWDAAHAGMRLVVPDHTAFAELYREYPLTRYMGPWETYTPYQCAYRYYRPYSSREYVSNMYLAYCDAMRDGMLDTNERRRRVVDEWMNVSGRWLHTPFRSAFIGALNLIL